MQPLNEQKEKQTWRTFFAIALPEELQRAIFTSLTPLIKQTKNQNIRLTPPQNLHITLRFLGNIERSQLPTIIAKVDEAVSRISPFSISLQELVLFPSSIKPHVIVLKTTAVSLLTQLALAIDRAVVSCRIAAENRPFIPHLTVARINGKFNSYPNNIYFPLLNFTVNVIQLYRSTPSLDGSIYTPIKSFPLRGQVLTTDNNNKS